MLAVTRFHAIRPHDRLNASQRGRYRMRRALRASKCRSLSMVGSRIANDLETT